MKKLVLVVSSIFSLNCAMAQITGTPTPTYWDGSSAQTTTTGQVVVTKTLPSLMAGGVNYSPLTLTTIGTSSIASFNMTHKANASATAVTDFYVTNGGKAYISNSLRIGATAANGTYANYALSVDGSIIAKSCVIQISSWADFVFNKDYSLPSLNSVEAYVKENNHLPGVPSEAEVKANGVDMGQMNKILMQKVEELTLYMIDLQKENKEIKDQLAQLKDKN